jgi:Tol biopolymer transport system component/DNA-binding winged helix-turn-helix (wHTH) protein
MTGAAGTGRRIRFGAFEVDRAAGELRKNGRRVPLQQQPFQVLLALVERPGEVVTREQLRERLWSGQTFVDFDQGLNTAINKLRDALGDSPANPHFVETLPRRGYRFTFPVDTGSAPAVEEPPGSRLQLRVWAAFAAVLVLAAGVLALRWSRRPVSSPQLPLRRFSIRTPVPIAFDPFLSPVVISPDGRHVAFVGREGQRKLWVRPLDREQPRAIEGSEGALGPFWSPGSDSIAFAAGGELKKVPLAGGLPTRVCEFPSLVRGYFGGAWSPDGSSMVFSLGGPAVLYEVPANGGVAKIVLTSETLQRRPGYLYNPHFLPSEAGPRVLTFAFGFESAAMILQDLDSGRREILGAGNRPFYSPSGHLLHRRSQERSELWAQPLSLRTLKATGNPFAIAHSATDPSVATDGTLVYLDAFFSKLVWLDRRGQRVGELGKPAPLIAFPSLSPDGRSLAAQTAENANLDVWIYDLVRGARTRLTSHPATEILPVWSPDGTEVAFGSYRTGSIDIFLRRADGGAEETLLAGAVHHQRVSDWSRDGQYILYTLLDPEYGADLWYLKRDAKGNWQPHLFFRSPANENAPKLSPDGRYVAYVSNEAGRNEVYVRPFPEGARKWVISGNGGTQVRWARNGRELFYLEAQTLVSVPVRTVPTFEPGRPARLFSHPSFTHWVDPNYDVSADGQRILLPETAGTEGSERLIRVVQNWFAEFRTQGR